jgi:hypothetical protein
VECLIGLVVLRSITSAGKVKSPVLTEKLVEQDVRCVKVEVTVHSITWLDVPGDL